MKVDYIRTFEGTILGLIETDENGNQTAKDWPSMKRLGTYYAKENVTKDFIGRVIGQGNIVVSLIKTNK